MASSVYTFFITFTTKGESKTIKHKAKEFSSDAPYQFKKGLICDEGTRVEIHVFRPEQNCDKDEPWLLFGRCINEKNVTPGYIDGQKYPMISLAWSSKTRVKTDTMSVQVEHHADKLYILKRIFLNFDKAWKPTAVADLSTPDVTITRPDPKEKTPAITDTPPADETVVPVVPEEPVSASESTRVVTIYNEEIQAIFDNLTAHKKQIAALPAELLVPARLSPKPKALTPVSDTEKLNAHPGFKNVALKRGSGSPCPCLGVCQCIDTRCSPKEFLDFIQDSATEMLKETEFCAQTKWVPSTDQEIKTVTDRIQDRKRKREELDKQIAEDEEQLKSLQSRAVLLKNPFFIVKRVERACFQWAAGRYTSPELPATETSTTLDPTSDLPSFLVLNSNKS